MSSGGGSASHNDQVRGVLRNDQVYNERDDDSLPPLPEDFPVGPEFDPSGSEESYSGVDLKPVHRFIPDSWKNFFRGSGSRKKPSSTSASDTNKGSSGGVRSGGSTPQSLPASAAHQNQNGSLGGSHTSRKEREARLLATPLDMVREPSLHASLAYRERLEAYRRRRHGHMKSWAGWLRVVGCVELLLGAAVFACVCAYIHKDNEWYNMFGYSQSQSQSYGGGYTGMGMPGVGVGAGVYYSGPQTIFVLVVAGVAWVTTVVLLVLGMTMYYRTILLASNCWPITEFLINLVFAGFYLIAGIVYVRDTTRGGLCYYPMFNNGLSGSFCQTEPGQTAAIAFLFITMVVYVIGAVLCLKVWRHEVAQRYRESLPQEATELSPPKALPVNNAGGFRGPAQAVPMATQPEVRHIPPARHMPKTLIMPDYITKYPSIRTDEERDQYRAVFKDQYAEYKELNAEVQAATKRFEEMDVLIRSLPQNPANQMERSRINKILQEYQRKKNDPAFLEKKERCDYLKNKLSHIKLNIQEYNKGTNWTDQFS
ncbi:MARVEL domain-containing protein 2-like [Anguilla anguilla]|uniref:MARVEL domain-containing protein 2-like n=1 Tax=Anguilla anguilla TaxID=7936 RepID=UPI0015B2F911|nr:MARVEL domain-containing protein 2-like [Anguilla anguilla]XP_035245634.1 MARVEL domain-containing protein 2-like [Anguilla anguilla]XP_035245635.1 MARVEL domain-containing protein 2-like [Anguilla anguilla]